MAMAMAKPTPASDSEHAASHNAVFVDTSLSTHLAVLVSDSDTVSDLKKKIVHEHPLCFPKIGEIEIQALKVKRRGSFYHLSETMLVRSAFAGVHKNWFVAVDVSRISEGYDGDPSLDKILLEVCGGTCNNLSCHQRCKSFSSESNQCVKQKVFVDDPQVVENLKRGVELLCHDHGKFASLDTNNSLGIDILEQLDCHIKEKPVQGVGTAGQEEVMKKSVSGDTEGSGAFDGALETEPHSKKKHKSKKRKRSIHNLDSKEDNISVDESGRNKLDQDTALPKISLGHGGGVVSPGIQMGVKNIADGPSMNLSSDVNETSVAIEMGTDTLNVGTEASREHVQFEDVQSAGSLKDTSQSESPAKKKHKTENEKGSPKTKGGRKSTKKLSDILPEETAAIPSPKKNVGVESSRDKVAANAKILDQNPDAVSLPGQHAQDVIRSEQFAPLPKEINCDSLQEPHKRASQDNSVSEVDADNMESRQDYSKIVSVSAAEQIKHNSPNAIEVVPHSSPVTKESNNIEKDVGLCVLENSHEAPTSQQAYEAENEGELLKQISPEIMLPTNPQPCSQTETGTSDQLDTSETVDPRKPSKKRRKSHKTRGLVSEAQAMSGTEHVKHPKNDIYANDTCETVNEDHAKDNKGITAESMISPKKGNGVSEKDRFHTSLLAMDREFNEVIPHVVESAQQKTENQVNAENIDGKSKKKSKRKQSSDPDGRLLDEVIPNVVESAQQKTENQVNLENIVAKSKKKSKRRQSSVPENEVIPNVVEQQKTENPVNAERVDGKSKKKSKRKQRSNPNSRLFDEMIPDVVESAQQKTENQVNAENIDEESKKKSNWKQSSDPDSQLKLQSEIEDVDHKAPDMEKRKDYSSIDKVNNEESNMPLKKGKEISEKHRNSTSLLSTDRELEKVMDQKSRKKLKRKQSSDPKVPSKLQSEIKDVGHKSSDVGTRAVNSSTDKFNNGESNVPLNKGNELSELDTVNTSLVATDREIDDIIKNVVESVQQMPETQVNGNKVNRKSREKSKKKQSSVSSTDNTKEVDSSSKVVLKAHLTSPNSSAQLNRSKFVHELDTGAENNDLGAQLNFTAVESSLAQVHELEGDIEHRDLGNANGSQQKSRLADKSPIDMEVTCGSNMIDFSDHFMPKQFHNETVASGKVLVTKKTKAMGANNEKKAKHNKPKLDGHSGSRVKGSQSSKSDELNSIAEGAKRYVRPSGSSAYTNNNKEIFSTSNSLGSLKNRNFQNNSIDRHKSHDVHLDGRKASATKAGEVVNGARHEKSLVGTSGAIFKDDSHGSSADEDVVGNSGSSTRTPSDNSVTSDYTNGESDIDFNSPQNGSYSLKRREAVARDIRSSGITLGAILRSSSSFKKAKLTASQSQLEETESQPVDFVPDSQANP